MPAISSKQQPGANAVWRRTWTPWVSLAVVWLSCAGGLWVCMIVPDPFMRSAFGVLIVGTFARSLFVVNTRMVVDPEQDAVRVTSGSWLGFRTKSRSCPLSSIEHVAYSWAVHVGKGGDTFKHSQLFFQCVGGSRFVLFSDNAVPVRPERVGKEIAERLNVPFNSTGTISDAARKSQPLDVRGPRA